MSEVTDLCNVSKILCKGFHMKTVTITTLGPNMFLIQLCLYMCICMS